MSKNLTRKGLAFGAMVALGSTLFAGAPALANSSGPLTLLPNGGTATGATYTSIIGAGLTLTSVLDADKQSTETAFVGRNVHGVIESVYDAVANAANDAVRATKVDECNTAANLILGADSNPLSINVTDTQGAGENNDVVVGLPVFWTADAQRSTAFVAAVDPIEHSFYLITNPGAADIKITIDNEDALYYIYDGDGNAGGDATADATDNFVKGALANQSYEIDEDAAEGALTEDGMQDDIYVTLGTVSGVTTYTTNATRIAVYAEAEETDTPGAKKLAPIKIDSDDPNHDTKITLTVTSLTDTIGTGANAGDSTTGKINNGEYRSATQEVNLLPVASVPTTTRMSMTTSRSADDLVATVALGGGVNPFAVAEHIGTVFYVDGSVVNIADIASTDEDIDSSAPVLTSGLVSGNVEVQRPWAVTANAVPAAPLSVGSTGVITVAAEAQNAAVAATSTDLARVNATDASKLISGVYTARTVFLRTTENVFMGARSVALDLRDGTNTSVTGATVVFTESDDLAVDGSNNAAVRAGTKTLTVAAQLDDDGVDYAAAGVRVRATVTGVTVASTSEITVTGSSEKIDARGDSIVVFGFTNSNGQFPITINSNNGARNDSVSVKLEALLDDGTYAGNTETITWERAELATELEVSPSEFLTGETINVTFTAVDQFGVGMDQNLTGRISIRVDAYVDGVVKTATYSETKATTNGAASFSFANFATAGSNQEIRVMVLNASVEAFTDYFTVYNNVATSDISVADEFVTSVQYVDFVTGKTSDPAVAKAAADVIDLFETALASDDTNYANIVGTVLDANNAGQPGSPVTIAAPGVLFHDLETKTLALDTITVFSNGQGFFDVQAMTQKLNTSGATVTITSGGKTVTTKLKSYLPTFGTFVGSNETGFDASLLKLDWTFPEVIVKDTTYPVVVTLTDVWGNPIRTLYDEDDEDNAAFLIKGEGSLQVNGTDEIRKNTNSNGQFTFFVRSVSDIAGPGTVRVTLADDFALSSPIHDDNIYIWNTSDEFEDVADTSWDESLWSNSLEKTLDVLNAAPAPTGKVNVGSFNGKLVVYAAGLDGAKISWKVAGRWGVANAVGNNLNRFDRPVGASGVNVIVEIYVNGVKQLTKTVLTR